MVLFVVDYAGTLDTLVDPVAWIQNLRHQHPQAVVMLYTGSDVGSIDSRALAVVDGVWSKPNPLRPLVEGVDGVERVVIYDDDPFVLRMHKRVFQGLQVEVRGPEEM